MYLTNGCDPQVLSDGGRWPTCMREASIVNWLFAYLLWVQADNVLGLQATVKEQVRHALFAWGGQHPTDAFRTDDPSSQHRVFILTVQFKRSCRSG